MRARSPGGGSRRRLLQRARHGDAAERPDRGAGSAGRVRGRPTPGELDEVHRRSHDGRGRSARGGGHGAGARPGARTANLEGRIPTCPSTAWPELRARSPSSMPSPTRSGSGPERHAALPSRMRQTVVNHGRGQRESRVHGRPRRSGRLAAGSARPRERHAGRGDAGTPGGRDGGSAIVARVAALGGRGATGSRGCRPGVRRGDRSRSRLGFGDLRSTAAFAEGYLTAKNVRSVRAPLSEHGHEHDGLGDHDRGRGPALSLTLNARMVAVSWRSRERRQPSPAGGRRRSWPGVWTRWSRVWPERCSTSGSSTRPTARARPFSCWRRDAAQARGAEILGEIAGVASRVLRARPHGVGRSGVSRAIGAALTEADRGRRDRVGVRRPGETLDATPGRRGSSTAPSVELARRARRSGLVRRARRRGRAQRRGGGLDRALGVGSRRRRGHRGGAMRPRLVHGLARGGTEVALVVR